MKKIITILVAFIIQFGLFAQTENTHINVSDDIELVKLSDHAYIHISYFEIATYGRVAANGLLYINNNEAFLFDSPWTNAQTEKLYIWLRDSMHITITGFIPNHWHEDCMGGLNFLQRQGVKSYANQMTIEMAKQEGLSVPDMGFKDSLELNLGDKLIMCYYLGGAHSTDNIVVWLPSDKILFAGCMIKSLRSRNLGNTADGDLVAYPKTLSKLTKLFPDAETVVPGHGRHGGLALIDHTFKLASD